MGRCVNHTGEGVGQLAVKDERGKTVADTGIPSCKKLVWRPHQIL